MGWVRAGAAVNMPLQLTTPVQGQALQQNPELRPAAVAEWLDGLLYLSPPDEAPQVLGALVSLNRWEMADEARQNLLLLYQPVVQKLIKSLIATLPENGTPQTQDHRQAAILAQELSLELSVAWKLVFLGIEQRLFAFVSGKARQNALGQLLVALSGLICTSFRIYTSPPAHSWHELHQVFHALYGIASQDAVEGLLENQPATLETAYKKALLLALADPFRFTRAEMEAALAYLNQHAALAQLAATRNINKTTFLINIDTDNPCCQTVDSAMTNALSLNTQALGKHLKRLARKLKQGESPEKLGLPAAFNRIHAFSLVGRLYQSWCGDKQRGFKRYPAAPQSYVEAVFGVDEIHKLFGMADGNLASHAVAPTQWRVIHDSASGVSIAARVRDVPQIRLGDPVVLRFSGSTDWMLGVIRRGKIATGLMVEAGVEKLVPSLSAAIVRVSQNKPANPAEQALLVPANAALQISERLMLPCGLYAPDRVADIWHNGQYRKIILRGLVEQSPVFDLVEFTLYS